MRVKVWELVMGHAALATFARLLLHANFFLYSPTLSACLSLTLYFFLSFAVPVAAWKYAVKNVIAFNVTIKQGKRRSRNAARRRKRSDWGRGSGRGSGDQLHSQLQLASLALHVPLATRQRATAKQQQKQQRRRRLSTCPQVGLNCQTERHSDSVQYIMKTVSHTHTPTLTSSDTQTHTQRALWFSGLQAVPLIKTDDQRQLAKATSTIFVLCLCFSFSSLSAFLAYTLSPPCTIIGHSDLLHGVQGASWFWQWRKVNRERCSWYLISFERKTSDMKDKSEVCAYPVGVLCRVCSSSAPELYF